MSKTLRCVPNEAAKIPSRRRLARRASFALFWGIENERAKRPLKRRGTATHLRRPVLRRPDKNERAFQEEARHDQASPKGDDPKSG